MMWSVSDLASTLPGPERGNLTKTSRIVAALNYRGDNLLGRMVTRAWPEQDESVEVSIIFPS